MGIDSVNPKSECEQLLDEVRDLKPTSDRTKIDFAIAKLVIALVNTEITWGEREIIFTSLGNKANSYENVTAMRHNKGAMYIAREIRDAVILIRNYLRALTPEKKERHLQKYRDLVQK